jgi:hypothetical protein
LYQTLSQPFVDDLATTATDQVASFMKMYRRSNNDPVELATVTVQPPVE